jgi:hypothetical protein
MGLRNSIELSTRRENGRDAIVADLCDAVESLMRMFDELSQGSSIYRLTGPRRAASKYMAKADAHVVPAKLGPNSGILGACLLPFGADSATAALGSNVGQHQLVQA